MKKLTNRNLVLSIVLAVLVPLAVVASNLTTPFTFAPGTPVKAADINSNFTAIQTAVNSKLDATRLPTQGTGIVSALAASTNLSGASTVFTQELAPGDIVVASGQSRHVVSVSSNTQVTVDVAYPAGFTNVNFTVQKPVTLDANLNVTGKVTASSSGISLAGITGFNAPNLVPTRVLYSTELYDDDNQFNNSVFTANTPGDYQFCASLYANGSFELDLYKNGIKERALGLGTNVGFNDVQGCRVVRLVAGDTVDVEIFQATGTPIAIANNAAYDWLTVYRQ